MLRFRLVAFSEKRTDLVSTLADGSSLAYDAFCVPLVLHVCTGGQGRAIFTQRLASRFAKAHLFLENASCSGKSSTAKKLVTGANASRLLW
eukprot:2199769-Amphidinium_carterae.1